MRTSSSNSTHAGAVNLGKTNMDEFAMGSSNETSYFGTVKNPWDTQRRARRQFGRLGRGGGGALVRRRDRHRHRRLDTPARRAVRHLRHQADLRPVSRYGMIAFASSLDQAGPMARSAEDLALLLNVMAGFDERDSTSLQRDKEDYARDLNKPLAGLRIGLPKEFFAEGLAQDVAGCVNAAIAEYKKLGATIVDISLPNSRLSVPVYYVLAPAEASSNLSRYDGVRYGYRAPEYGDLTEMYEKSRAQGFGAEVKRRIMIGTYVLSHGYYDAYYLQGAEDPPPDRAGFRRCVQAMRRHHGADQPEHRIQSRRKGRRPGADVSVRHLHDRGEPGRPARHVDPCGLRRAMAPGRPADHRQLFRRGADAECRAPIPAGDRIITPCSARFRGCRMEFEKQLPHRHSVHRQLPHD